MQILKFKTIFIIFVSILLFTNIIQTYAQDYVVSGSKCAEITQPQTIPHNGIIKVLIVYIKYQDDNFNLPPWTDEWPSNMGDNRPEWTNYMLSPEPDQLDFEPSITGYFKSMSLGQCKIIGDEYPINNKVYLANQISTYRSWLPYPCAEGPQAISLAVKEALTIYDDQIDYRQYDNDGPDGVPNSGDDDGYVDLIIAWFRFHNAGTTDCNGYNGVASLTGLNQNWFQRNPFIYDISTQDIGYNGQPIKINQNSGLIAEGTSRNNINIMVHEIGHKMGWGHYWHVGLWNMMGAKQGVGIMNTFERNVLGGWITPGKITIINSPVIHTNFNLKDFETTGEAIRLITNNGGDYILENRSGLSFYSRKGGWLMPNNGLLITRNGWETIECANHRWDWIKNSGGNCGSWCNNTYTFHTENNQFFRLNPTNTGLSTIELSGVCTDNNGCFSHPEGGGAAGNVYIQEYNEVFSTWSNPSSIGGITNNQDIVIEYLSRNADSSMNLYIHYDLPNGFQNTSPSKPLWLRVEKDFFEPGNPYKFHPKLIWLPNQEPDITGYKIYRGNDINPDPEPTYDFVTQVGEVTQWVDNDVILYEDGTPYPGCQLLKRYYSYKIEAVDNESKVSVRSERGYVRGFIDPCADDGSLMPQFINNEKPKEFSILNYPNPFNPKTHIRFSIPADGTVKVKVYNLLGEEIFGLTENLVSGNYSILFDGTNHASGVYIYSVESGSFYQAKKMVLIK